MRTGSLAVACLADVPDGPILARNAEGALAAIRTPEPGQLYRHHLECLAWMDEMVANHGLRRALAAADLEAAHKAGQPAIVADVEGLDFLDGKLERLEEAHQRGIRHLQLVHYTPNDIGDFQTGAIIHRGSPPLARRRLVTLAEGEIGELHVGLKGTMNALFLKDLAQKVRRGLEGRVREGRSGGGMCFGYDIVREYDARGDAVRGGRQINETEAAIVRRIFTEFAAGTSPRRIALRLNRDNIPGPRGGQWDASTINGNAARGTGILNNELYIGRLVWNRLRYVKDPATGKRISRPNEPEHLVVREVPELRIAPQQLWDAVKHRQSALKRNTRPDLRDKPFWERQRPRYLITGLAKCGACGSSYVKISATLFGCAAARNRGTCGNRLNIRLDRLETMILDGLRYRLMAPDLFKSFCEEFHRELNRLRIDGNAAIEAHRHELDRIERRIRRIVELITEDDVPVRALKEELVTLEARQLMLQQELAASVVPAPLLHPNLAEVYRQRIERLHEALQDASMRDQAFELIRSLIEEIRLVPENGELRVELKGELAGILALAADKKKPDGLSAAGLSQQIKMVAGARNHRRFEVSISI